MDSFVCLVHYHEIGLKGNNRSVFERRLLENLKRSLHGLPVASVERISGHVLVRLDGRLDRPGAVEVFERIRQTPGVARVSFARRCDLDPEAYCAAALLELEASGDFDSFKVRARRSNTVYPMTSLELNEQVGSYLCSRLPEKRVLMKDPDRTVFVYVIQGSVYVYVKTEEGVGGLPVGSAGKVISLLSSGIDSPVASWRIMRRGAVVLGLHFSGRPQTSDASEWLVQDIIDRLSPAGGFGRLYVVPFGDVQRRVALAVPDDLRIIMYRRLMFAFASRLAKLENAKALVTGESLGQVASQTLENIMAVDEMADIPVFRPLIGSDKREIMDEAERLGTLEISNEKAPDCCTLFMPRSPETHVSMKTAHEVWDSFDHESMLDEMMASLEYRSLDCPVYHAPRSLREFHGSLAPAWSAEQPLPGAKSSAEAEPPIEGKQPVSE